MGVYALEQCVFAGHILSYRALVELKLEQGSQKEEIPLLLAEVKQYSHRVRGGLDGVSVKQRGRGSVVHLLMCSPSV